ncbi:MAG TPA: HepT-like ribonuclease domain-containing protein [Acetobacteraceae bacterium]|nr:HepT-like ribonuclease domain-containing protein [Acetobacteraceae bacterium]
MTRAVAERLTDIREAARDVIDITGALEDGAFHALPHADRIAHRALKNALSELGEAVKALPPELAARHANVDWRGFAGLRDVVSHGYFSLRQDLLWPIVRDELPQLLAAVAHELSR